MLAGDDIDAALLSVLVGDVHRRDVGAPQHREVRRHELVRARQVDPDLEQLDRIGRVLVHEREHLGVDDAVARREPLCVAVAETRRRAERIGVIDEAATRDGERLEAAVRVLREARHDAAVIHAPAVLALEVLADVPTGERGHRPELLIARGVRVVVVDTEEKGIDGLPRETERPDFDDVAHAPNISRRRAACRPPTATSAPAPRCDRCARPRSRGRGAA